jgi:uncharacterized MAPEG superfamily protein
MFVSVALLLATCTAVVRSVSRKEGCLACMASVAGGELNARKAWCATRCPSSGLFSIGDADGPRACKTDCDVAASGGEFPIATKIGDSMIGSCAGESSTVQSTASTCSTRNSSPSAAAAPSGDLFGGLEAALAAAAEFTNPIKTATILFLFLWMKVFATNLYTGMLKRKCGGGPPEDKRTGAAAGADAGAAAAPPAAVDPAVKEAFDRWTMICNNDAENLPLGIIAMFISAQLIPATANVDVIRFQVACAVLWVALRIAHTVVYALALQPWRTVVYIVGVIFVVIMIILAIVGAFAGGAGAGAGALSGLGI